MQVRRAECAMVQDQSDFPLLTRSRRFAPKVLKALERVDTESEPPLRWSQLFAQVDEATLQTLPDIINETVWKDPPEHVKMLHRLAVLYHSQNKFEKAEALYRRALDMEERGPNLEGGLILNNFARLLHDRGRLAEAEALYQRALDILQKTVGPEHPKLATPMGNLAKLYLDQNKPELAKKMYQNSIAVLEKAHGPGHPKVVKARKKLDRIL